MQRFAASPKPVSRLIAMVEDANRIFCESTLAGPVRDSRRGTSAARDGLVEFVSAGHLSCASRPW